MKLRNKKTGEIVEDAYVRETHDFQFDGQKHVLAVFKSNGHSVPERISGPYNSLSELNEEWEDYEEPKELYIVDGRQSSCGGILKRETDADWYDHMIELGLGFRTNEELEQAIEKLKAWKRLKDRGFKFKGYNAQAFGEIKFSIEDDWEDCNFDHLQHKADLDLLFGGEE